MANLNFNKVIIGGRLTATPELKSTTGGNTITVISVAVKRRKDKNGNQETDFLNVCAWNNVAEILSKHFKKGSCVLIEGSLRTRKYVDKDGKKRILTEILAERINFVDEKKETALLNSDDSKIETPAFEELGDNDDLPF